MAVTAKTAEVHSLLEVLPSRECHCHHCGARIAEGDAVCAACGKKQQVRNRQLLDFLIAHTKDTITDKITDSIYEAVKNFMLSHLFGVVVSISLVAAAGVTVYATEPYIERVTPSHSIESEYAALIAELNLLAQELGFENAEEMLRVQERWDVYTELFGPYVPEEYEPVESTPALDALYYERHDQVQRQMIEYWRCAESPPDYYVAGTETTMAEAMQAMRIPDDLGYVTTFEYGYTEAMAGAMSAHSYGTFAFSADEFQSDLAKMLSADGYLTCEFDDHIIFTLYNYVDGQQVTEDVLEMYVRFVVVNVDGTWYAAGDEILSSNEL